jgi:hypothetical protein
LQNNASLTPNERGVTLDLAVILSSQRSTPGILVIAALLLFSSSRSASAMEIRVAPVVDTGTGAADVALTSQLCTALQRHNLEGWTLACEETIDGAACEDQPGCVAARTFKTAETYSIVLSAAGHKVSLSRKVKLDQGCSPLDIAETLALKIIFMLQKIKIDVPMKTKPYAQGKTKPGSFHPPVEVAMQEAADEEPAESKEAGGSGESPSSPEPGEGGAKDMPVGEIGAPAGGGEASRPEGSGKPGPGDASVDVAVTGPPPSAGAPKPPPKSRRGKFFHLGIGAAYMTGFTEDFNTGGLELNGIFTVYGPVALRLDAGFHPIGAANDDGVRTKYYTLPVDVMGGYYRDFRKLHIGVYGGLDMMAMWFDYQAAGMGSSSDFVIGAALIFEMAYVINRTVSLGMFVRPTYISDDVSVSDDELDTDGNNETDDTTIFTLPKFLFTCGLVAIVSF